MVGRDLESRFPEHTPQIGEVFFEVKNWRVQHPTRTDRLVCKNSAFTVRRGEIVGFAGLMGAGRTELMRSIFGRSYGTFLGGTITLNGKERSSCSRSPTPSTPASPTSPRTARPSG
jgi:putative multiple sugar transport system ATP-binding protein